MTQPFDELTTESGAERNSTELEARRVLVAERNRPAGTEPAATPEPDPGTVKGGDAQRAGYERRMAEVDRLGDEIAVLSAQITSATYELLARLREFDRREGWFHHGARSCAHWLAWRTSLDMGAAREKVRVARTLEHLPILSEAMRKGEVSYSKAHALTRIATPETEAALVSYARAGTTSHIERIVRACRKYGPKEELDEARRLHSCRYLQVCHDEDGMVILRARLEPVAGAAVLRALDAAGEALYQKGRADAGDEPGKDSSGAAQSPTPQCRGTLTAAVGGSAGTDRRSETRNGHRPGSACRDAAGDELSREQRRADALVLVAESALAGGLDPGTRGDRYQVVVHVDAPVLADPAEQGVSALSDGQHVSAETSRRLACDAAEVVITHDQDGSVLDVGRKTRTISPALRRALTERDGGCRFPGCGLQHCDAHHIQHWAEGGETSLDNTLLLCRHHHRLMHEEMFQVTRSGSRAADSRMTAVGTSGRESQQERLTSGEVEFRRPDGRLLPAAPMPPPNGGIDPAVAIAKRLQDGAIVVGPYTGTPTWDGTRVDLSLAVEWFLAATARTEEGDLGSAGKASP